MARTVNSIVINRPRDFVFQVTNDLSKWPQLFTEYKEVKILSREGNKITFQLTTYGDEKHPGMTWKSSRVIDVENWKIFAQREEPIYPWTHMRIEWIYGEDEHGTSLTFIQEFGVDPKSGYTDEDGVKFINENSKKEMQHIKKILEQEL